MIIPTGYMPVSSGTRRAFASLLLTAFLTICGAVVAFAIWLLTELFWWVLADADPLWAVLIVAFGALFTFVWATIWSVMKSDGLFED